MISGCQESGGAGHCIEASHAVDPTITLGRIETPEEPKTWGCPSRLHRCDKPCPEEEYLDRAHSPYHRL